MFLAEWLASAREELAASWTGADPTVRKAIRAAAASAATAYGVAGMPSSASSSS
jgi:hypothetical protein